MAEKISQRLGREDQRPEARDSVYLGSNATVETKRPLDRSLMGAYLYSHLLRQPKQEDH